MHYVVHWQIRNAADVVKSYTAQEIIRGLTGREFTGRHVSRKHRSLTHFLLLAMVKLQLCFRKYGVHSMIFPRHPNLQ